MIEFSDIPYFQYVSQSDGTFFPEFLQLNHHEVFSDWINQDHRYDSFLKFYNNLGLQNKKKPTIQEIGHLVVYRNYLIDYLTNASNSLMKKDEKIKKTLRHLYIIAIKKENTDRLQIDNDFLEFFNAIQRAVPEDSIRKYWINESIVNHIEIEKETDSIEYILYIIKQRDRIFNNVAIYYQKLIHIETALYFIETSKPFTKDLPGDFSNEPHLTALEIQAIDNVSMGGQIPNKRKILIEYLKLSKNANRSKIQSDFEKQYNLKPSTFYDWTKKLHSEIKSISRTGI